MKKNQARVGAALAAAALALTACGGPAASSGAASAEAPSSTAGGESPSMANVKSIQAITDGTIYGTCLTEVQVTYQDGVDLSGITEASYVLEDRGTLTPDFGAVDLASATVSGSTVTLTVLQDSDATAENRLVYTGDNKEGPRQRNTFGAYVTGAWYRDAAGVIHFGEDPADEYEDNTTQMGYQARHSLELTLRHANEAQDAAVAMADDKGEAVEGGLWLPTQDLQFGEGGFNSFEAMGIEIPSTAAKVDDGTADAFVKGFAYVPANYDPAKGIVFTLQGQGISYWQLEDGTNNYGTTLMFDTATTSWKSTGAIVVNIQDRSSVSKDFGAWYETYDFVQDDVAVMKYFLDTYKVTGPVVMQGNSRGTMACGIIIRALAGQPYNPQEQNKDFDGEKDKLLDKTTYDFTVDSYICQNGFFLNNCDAKDVSAIAATGQRVWAIDGEQDTDNIETIATYLAEKAIADKGEDWARANVRLTGLPSELYSFWGESDHSTTRLVGWYFANDVYRGPELTVNADGTLSYAKEVADGDTYTLLCRGKAAGSPKDGYAYTQYTDNFHEWALRTAE